MRDKKQLAALNAKLDAMTADQVDELAREGRRAATRKRQAAWQRAYFARQALAAREATEHNNSASVHGREEL